MTVRDFQDFASTGTATRRKSQRPANRPALADTPGRAGDTDAARILATLTAAFIADPPVRWLFPRTVDYLAHFPRFARAFGGGALAAGTAWHIPQRGACALWHAPGQGPDDQALAAMVEHCLPTDRQAEVFAVFEAMGEIHPTQPHWHLPLIGVAPAAQGRGLGSVLLEATLHLCDRHGMPAYLEATSPRSALLYERHGFRRREALRVASCPPIVPMWREPQALSPRP